MNIGGLSYLSFKNAKECRGSPMYCFYVKESRGFQMNFVKNAKESRGSQGYFFKKTKESQGSQVSIF